MFQLVSTTQVDVIMKPVAFTIIREPLTLSVNDVIFPSNVISGWNPSTGEGKLTYKVPHPIFVYVTANIYIN